jgi:rubrerythrin
MTPTPDAVQVAIPRPTVERAAARLRLAIRDGYDDADVLADLLAQLAPAGNGRRPRVRGTCRLCDHVLAEIPPVASCPACGGRYLVFTREEAAI